MAVPQILQFLQIDDKGSAGFPCGNLVCLPLRTIQSFVPAAPCSSLLPVFAAPAVPLAIPFFLANSAASSGFGPTCPGSTIF